MSPMDNCITRQGPKTKDVAQLSAISYQLSAISYQLSAISYQKMLEQKKLTVQHQCMLMHQSAQMRSKDRTIPS
ncbi:hypothetical protein FDK21_05995 [Cohaesibacter sp. CAU 1516]|nr:hypothetical protein FDK21_05995 [Cohaesibacter sp. CAU 1516]